MEKSNRHDAVVLPKHQRYNQSAVCRLVQENVEEKPSEVVEKEFTKGVSNTPLKNL